MKTLQGLPHDSVDPGGINQQSTWEGSMERLCKDYLIDSVDLGKVNH